MVHEGAEEVDLGDYRTYEERNSLSVGAVYR